MKAAGVFCTVGRESRSQYGESIAGVQEHSSAHQWPVKVSPFAQPNQVLPLVQSLPYESAGTGDKKVQAYNFRMILSEDPANSVAFPKPPNYDPKRYELMARLLEAMTKHLGRAPIMHEVTLILNDIEKGARARLKRSRTEEVPAVAVAMLFDAPSDAGEAGSGADSAKPTGRRRKSSKSS